MMTSSHHFSSPASSRHLPPHLAPLEPHAERHHGYHLQAARRGSTDPSLHASLAASSAGSSTNYSYGNGVTSPNPFDASRRRSIQVDPMMPPHGSYASPHHRYMPQNHSPTNSSNNTTTTSDHATLPPLSSHEGGESRSGQIQSNYQFGNNFAPRHEEKHRIPHLSAPNGDGGGAMIEGGHHNDSRRGSSGSLSSKHLLLDKDNKPYSRSPELRVSHKLAERKRRKEMKELFDDLRDLLPVDQGPKTSKWEILSKAVDHISSIQDDRRTLLAENERLRAQLKGTTAITNGTRTFDSQAPPTQR